ncbi:MAG: hypothetical protein WKF92_07675 [Pyrinomonadaceae bacterium]
MFEQSLYNQPEPEQKPQEGDLFRNYEVGRWNFSKRIYQIFAIAAVFNILGIVFLAQTNVLTARGCESPFVGRVCQVLDTVYIGALLFGTEREYADVAYERTELADADITFIDVSTPLFEYPANYFQPPAIDPYAAQLDPMSGFSAYPPGFTPNPTIGNDIINTPPIMPKPNVNAANDDVTGNPWEEDNTPTVAVRKPGKRGSKRSNGSATTNPTVDETEDTTAKNNPTANPVPDPQNPDESKTDQFGVTINQRPTKDFGKQALEKIEKGTVKLDSPFKVVIEGTLSTGKDGKTIVLKNPKPIRTKTNVPSDPNMEKLAQEAVLAVGDAGWFGYLDKLKSKKVVISIEQNESNFIVSVKADQPSENEAKFASSGLNTILSIATPLAKGDEQTFLKLGKTTYEGKTFVLNFDGPKALLQELIQRKLAESKEKESKPNGTALVPPNNNTAKK